MKTLTVRQPWAWAIARGHKPVENRGWSTDHHGPLPVENVKAVETHDRSCVLAFPLKAAIVGAKNYAVRADRPTMALVIRETNCADRVALRQGVLPFPSPIAALSKSNRRPAKRNDD